MIIEKLEKKACYTMKKLTMRLLKECNCMLRGEKYVSLKAGKVCIENFICKEKSEGKI